MIEYKCPKCGELLFHFSGLENIPAYYYCVECLDLAFDEDGNVIAKLE